MKEAHSDIIHNPSTTQIPRLVNGTGVHLTGVVGPSQPGSPETHRSQTESVSTCITSDQACGLVSVSKPTELRVNTMSSKSGHQLSNT